MKNFRTYQLAKSFYQDCQSLKLTQPAKDQFDRALLSVLLNLAEGSAKPTAKDRQKFYSIALGALREVQVLLELTGAQSLIQASDTVAACLFCLIRNSGGRA